MNPTFLVREMFLKSSRIFCLKNNKRWHEGFKLPLYTFHVVIQIQANFTSIAKSILLLLAIFVPYFFSFVFVTVASTFFHAFF